MGETCVDRINGIFAFGVYEEQRGRLFLARDRIGVKPLFYAAAGEAFVFASEIKTILALSGMEAVITAEGVCEVMLLGPGRTPGCGVFRGVCEVRPGWRGFWADGDLQLAPYWRLTDRPHGDDLAATVATVRTLLTDSIRRQLVSDVPVGSFCPAGWTPAFWRRWRRSTCASGGQALDTFSVTYRDNDRYFRATKFQPSSRRRVHRPDDRRAEKPPPPRGAGHRGAGGRPVRGGGRPDLPGMADVDSSLLLFCRAVRKDITVALSGECADEIFGGYPWYRDPDIRERRGFPWAQSTAWRASLVAPDALRGADPFEYVDGRCRATLWRKPMCSRARTRGEKRMREMTRLNFDWFMQTLLEAKDIKENEKKRGHWPEAPKSRRISGKIKFRPVKPPCPSGNQRRAEASED